MAGPETIHRVVEQFEIKGAEDVEKAFAKIGVAADKLSMRLGHGQKELGRFRAGLMGVQKSEVQKALDAVDKITNPDKKPKKAKKPEGADTWFERAAASAKRFGINLPLSATDLFTEAVKRVIGVMRDLVVHAFDVNVTFERATNRVQGLVQGLVDFGKISPMERANRAASVGSVLMKDYQQIAYDTAQPFEEIERAASRINPILSGLGKTQRDVVDLTRLSAAAAKVYGERAEESGKIVAKAIATGSVEGEGAFAMAFKSMAKLDAKMSVEKRMRLATEVLSGMAEPIDAVTKGTDAAIARLHILTDDILRRATEPVYRAIGDRIGEIVGWMKQHDGLADSVAEKTSKLLSFYEKIESITSSIGASLGPVASALDSVGDKLNFLNSSAFGLLAESVEFIVTGVDAMAASIDKLFAGGSWEKLETTLAQLALEFQEVLDKITGIMTAIAKPIGLERFVPKLAIRSQEDLDENAARLRSIEKTRGLQPSTDATRKLAELEKSASAKQAEEDLKRKGKEVTVTQQIGTLVVNQDLRGEEPDAIMVEFVGALEKLGENAYQSTVATGGTVYGPGGG